MSMKNTPTPLQFEPLEYRVNDPTSPNPHPETYPPSPKKEGERYVPYSGGSMCWYGNLGIMKTEMSNAYRFYEEMNGDDVRKMQFQRWSVAGNRRSSGGREKRSVPIIISCDNVLSEERKEANTIDISLHGVRTVLPVHTHLIPTQLVQIALQLQTNSEDWTEIESQTIWVRPVQMGEGGSEAGLSFFHNDPETLRLLHVFLNRS